MTTLYCYQCLKKGKQRAMKFLGRDPNDEMIGLWECEFCKNAWMLIKGTKVQFRPKDGN